MKRIVNFIGSLALLITMAAVGVSAQSFAPREASASSSMERQIYKSLLTLPRYGVFDFINFKVEGGTVVLDGKTISLGTRSAAAAAVKRVPGVTNVVNNIDELPLSSLDNSIRRQMLQTFADKGFYRYLYPLRPDVRIIVENGRVTLEGFVSNSGDYNALNIYAHGVPGVFHVQNNLVIGKDLRR